MFHRRVTRLIAPADRRSPGCGRCPASSGSRASGLLSSATRAFRQLAGICAGNPAPASASSRSTTASARRSGPGRRGLRPTCLPAPDGPSSRAVAGSPRKTWEGSLCSRHASLAQARRFWLPTIRTDWPRGRGFGNRGLRQRAKVAVFARNVDGFRRIVGPSMANAQFRPQPLDRTQTYKECET